MGGSSESDLLGVMVISRSFLILTVILRIRGRAFRRLSNIAQLSQTETGPPHATICRRDASYVIELVFAHDGSIARGTGSRDPLAQPLLG